MCAVAARLARVVKCCVTSPDDDVTTDGMAPRMMPDVISAAAAAAADDDMDSADRSSASKATDWTGCYSSDTDSGFIVGPELVCCCDRCDSISGWLLVRPTTDCAPAAAVSTDSCPGGGGGTPFRLRNCLLACEVDRIRHGRISCLDGKDCAGEDCCVPAPDASMSCSLLAADTKRSLSARQCQSRSLNNNRVANGRSIAAWSPVYELTGCHQAPPNKTIGHLYVAANSLLLDAPPSDQRFCPNDRLREVDDESCAGTKSSPLCCLLTLAATSRSRRAESSPSPSARQRMGSGRTRRKDR